MRKKIVCIVLMLIILLNIILPTITYALTITDGLTIDDARGIFTEILNGKNEWNSPNFKIGGIEPKGAIEICRYYMRRVISSSNNVYIHEGGTNNGISNRKYRPKGNTKW